jgi:hypothetical protein
MNVNPGKNETGGMIKRKVMAHGGNKAFRVVF